MTTNHAEALTHYTDAIAAINSHIAALPRTEAEKKRLNRSAFRNGQTHRNAASIC